MRCKLYIRCLMCVSPQGDPANPAPTLGEIIFTVFDWMITNKSSLNSTKDIWEFTRSLFPPGNDMGEFEAVMAILKRHRLETLQVIPVCVNMCVAYWNPTHPKMQGTEFRNAHRTKCPVCNCERSLPRVTCLNLCIPSAIFRSVCVINALFRTLMRPTWVCA